MKTSLNTLLSALLPDLPGTQFEGCLVEDPQITVFLQKLSASAACPQCHQTSSQVRSHYWRTLWDLPWAHRVVRLRLRLGKFACNNAACPQRIFAERLPTLAAYARSTARRITCQERIGLALGGEAGARLSQTLSLATSAATLLRRIRQLPEPAPSKPRVIGVDDWALRKGVRYGTLLVDLEKHRPLDLFPERTAEGLISWLKHHPQIEVISRDRSTEYARAATEGAPQALQVADRFHLIANFREALQHLVERHRSKLAGVRLPHPQFQRATMTERPSHLPQKRSPLEEAQRRACQHKRRERHRQVHALRAEGKTIVEIARQLHLNRQTVYRYLRLDAVSAEQRHHPARSGLDAYFPYLLKRWAEGCQNAMQLWREISEQGYSGTHKRVNVWAQQQRSEPAPKTPLAYRHSAVSPKKTDDRLPSPRAVAFFLIRRPDQLSAGEKQVLEQINHASSEIAQGYALFHQFAEMLRLHTQEKFSKWIETARASNLMELQNFALGLEKERAAIEAAIFHPWSNAQTEGQVNRLKMLKRQMYGRAKFDLLRRRVLYA